MRESISEERLLGKVDCEPRVVSGGSGASGEGGGKGGRVSFFVGGRKMKGGERGRREGGREMKAFSKIDASLLSMHSNRNP